MMNHAWKERLMRYAICGWTLSAIICLAAPAFAQPVVYQAKTVYTMAGEPLSPGQVLVIDGKIAAVGTTVDTPEGATLVDLGTGCLMPGFIDAYTQSGISGGNDEYTREVTPGFKTVSVIDWKDAALLQALDSGTTTVAVAPGTENVIGGVSCIIKTSGKNVSDRVLKSELGLVVNLCSDPTQRNQSRSRPDSIFVRQPTNRMGVVWLLRSTFSRAGIDRMMRSVDVIQDSLAGDLPIFAVCRTSYDMSTLATLAEEFDFQPVAIGGQEAYKIAPLLVERKIPVILGPLTTQMGSGPENTEVILNQPGVLAEHGVPFALSGGNLLEQARFACRFGLEPESAMEAITRTPAEMLGVADRVGTLSPGKDADMVAFDGHPLEFTTSIRWVMINGQRIDEQD